MPQSIVWPNDRKLTDEDLRMIWALRRKRGT